MIPPGRAVRLICFVTALLMAVGTGPAVAAAVLSDELQDTDFDDPTLGTDSGPVESTAVDADGADDEADEAADEDEVDGRSTAATVRLVVGSLIAVAAGTAIMMLIFVWHTSPRRRFRVATRRADRRRAAAASVDSEVDEVDRHNDGADDDDDVAYDDAANDGADDDAANEEAYDTDESEDSGVGGSRE